MTLPPGAAALLASVFSLMAGLKKPSQRRRTSSGFVRDARTLHRLLSENLGCGFFSTDRFSRAPVVDTDASKSKAYVGGGYFSRSGHYRFWEYARSARRELIDFLEGDVVVTAMRDLGHLWAEKVVRFRVDNQAFQKSAVKGNSRASRLSTLLREVFSLSIGFRCIFEFDWLASAENVFGDGLSRPEPEIAFFQALADHEHGLQIGAHFIRHPLCGVPKRAELCLRGGGPGRGTNAQPLSVPYPACSVFTGLPRLSLQAADDLLGHRLAPSSLESVSAALKHWDKVRVRHGWGRIIRSLDPIRGAKMLSYLLYCVHETELAATSIQNYVWALCQYMKLKRQLNPVMGVAEWVDYMKAMAVVCWVPCEPRATMPLHVVEQVLDSLNPADFMDIQLACLILMLLFTFARSETPLPGAWTGPSAPDPLRHLRICDVVTTALGGQWATKFRLKIIKQDPKLQRNQASAGEDWVYVGDAQGVFSLKLWLARLYRAWDPSRAQDDFFFLDADRVRTWRYSDALRAFQRAVVAVGYFERVGLHTLRVLGWNLGKQGPEGTELAICQGGWEGIVSASRYDRFPLLKAVELASHQVVIGLKAAQTTVNAALSSDSNDEDDESPPQAAPRPGERALLAFPPPPENLAVVPQFPGRLGSARQERRATFGMGRSRSSSAPPATGHAAMGAPSAPPSQIQLLGDAVAGPAASPPGPEIAARPRRRPSPKRRPRPRAWFRATLAEQEPLGSASSVDRGYSRRFPAAQLSQRQERARRELGSTRAA